MMSSIPWIVTLALIHGCMLGYFWPILFGSIYKPLFTHLMRLLPEVVSLIVSGLFTCVVIFLFFISGLIFSPFISDELWVYFYKSYFGGILLGIFIKNWLVK